MKKEHKLDKKETIFIVIMLLIGILFFNFFFKTKNIFLVILPVLIILHYTRKYKYKVGFLILLILLLEGLIYYLAFEPLLARRGRWDMFALDFSKFNLIPFKTILEYLKGMLNVPYAYKMNYDNYALFLNLIGNLFCFSPLAILLPLSFEKMKKRKNLLLTTLIFCVVIEIAQFFSMNGSFDIDDIILNYSGFVLVHLLVKKDFLNFIEKLILDNNKEFSNKKIIFIFSLVLITFISLAFAYNYRYKKETEYISYISNFNIEYKYTGDYIEDYIELIYEDDYIYVYLNHYKAESVVIKIYDEEMPLTKWTKGETIYYLNIYKLLDTDMDIDIIEKEKKNLDDLLTKKLFHNFCIFTIIYFI